MAGPLIRGEVTETCGEKMATDNGVREWSDTSKTQGMPRIASKHQKIEEARMDSPLQISERAWLCQQLDFKILASRIVRQKISVVLSHSVCGTLLWQP